MPNTLKEQGFTHLLAVLVFGFLAVLFTSSLIPINRSYNDGKSDVAGVYLAKDGDSSGAPSGSSTTVVKFEIKNGEVEVETKVKSASEVEKELEKEAENEAVKEVETELEKEDVKVATAPGQIALVNKRVGALSTFPLSVNPTTRQLTVTTPAGSKVVAVLPEKAINNMLAAHIMDDVVSEKVNNSLASVPKLVKLEIKNGVLGYQVKGTKTHKLLGLIPIKTAVATFVSAENGQVVETSQSLLGRILNRIAP